MAKLPPTTDNLAKEKARIAILDETFAIIAKDKSTCPSKDQGGDVGWFTRDGVMVENFSKTAFGLTPYLLSDPVKTQFGYHLILTTEKKPGKEVKFEELKGEAKEYFAEKLRERMSEHVRKFSKITIYPAPLGT
jgi:peptidyl-prolyl cis-trans isomerase C